MLKQLKRKYIQYINKKLNYKKITKCRKNII